MSLGLCELFALNTWNPKFWFLKFLKFFWGNLGWSCLFLESFLSFLNFLIKFQKFLKILKQTLRFLQFLCSNFSSLEILEILEIWSLSLTSFVTSLAAFVSIFLLSIWVFFSLQGIDIHIHLQMIYIWM